MQVLYHAYEGQVYLIHHTVLCNSIEIETPVAKNVLLIPVYILKVIGGIRYDAVLAARADDPLILRLYKWLGRRTI